jgi:hypothetical protein
MLVSQGLVVRVIQEINEPTDRRLACPGIFNIFPSLLRVYPPGRRREDYFTVYTLTAVLLTPNS